MKTTKRILATILSLMLLLMSFSACQQGGNTSDTTAATTVAATTASATTAAATTAAKTTAAATTAAATTAAATNAPTTAATTAAAGDIFPLAEEITYDFMLTGTSTDFPNPTESANKNKFWQDVKAATNINIEFRFIGTDWVPTLNAMYAAGTIGDVMATPNTLNDAQVAQFGAAGLLAELEDYITPELMPNYYANAVSAVPTIMGLMTSPNGHIYALACLNAFRPNGLESPLIMNTKWIEQSGLKSPTTQDELYELLVYFRDHDMNGNGNVNDEIPYFFYANQNFSSLPAILSLWGIATKSSALDSYVQVKDGVVTFVPTSENFHVGLRTIGQWYKDGLIWSEAFTANEDTYNAVVNSEIALAGAYNHRNLPTQNDVYDYVAIEGCDGFKSCYYQHPSFTGIKNMFFVTNKCENVDVLMHWVDYFMDTDHARAFAHNYVGEGQQIMTADGKYASVKMSKEEQEAIRLSYPSINQITGMQLYAFNEDFVNNKTELNDTQKNYKRAFELYTAAGISNTQIWPRPNFTEEDATRLSELRTDIFNTVSIQSAKWGSGQGDINAEWDSYVAELEAVGLQEYITICQTAYDIYNNAVLAITSAN